MEEANFEFGSPFSGEYYIDRWYRKCNSLLYMYATIHRIIASLKAGL